MISEKYGRNTLLVGPWGGHDGLHWDDGVYSTIRQLEICHGSGIDWIKIEYDNNGSSAWSEKHGGRGGSKIDKVRLEYPDEFLISLHGHYGSLQEWGRPIFVRSLTFESNKRKYGPYGIEEGTYFTFSPNHGKIVGFLGKSGWYLDAIGAYLQPLHEHVASDPILHKPVAANPILHKPISAYPVHYKPLYADPIIQKATASDPILHKPVAANPILHKPISAYPVHYKPLYADPIIQKSTASDPILHKPVSAHPIHDKPVYADPILRKPVYADPILRKPVSADPIIHSQQHVVAHGNEKCEYSMIQGSIDQNYDLILAVKRRDGKNNNLPTHHLTKTHSNTEHNKQMTAILVPSKIEEVPNKIARGLVKCGPWGGSGGTLFDDGIYDGIRQINLKRNVGIVSIQVCYEKSGQPVWGSKNGGTGSFKKDKIIFDYPSEILTYITGYHSPAMVMGPDVIKSLTFHTTRGKHGPYGEEQGHFFSSKLNEGSTIVGFHGKKGLFMDAIGIHALSGKVVPPPSSHYKEAVFSSNSKNSASYTLPASSNYQNARPINKVDNSQWHLSVRGQTEEVVQRMVKDPAPFGTGPWGGDSGKPWDDGVFTGIKQIVLTISDAITCIEFEYDRNDQSVWSVKHGGTGGQTAHRVRLEYPTEVLTCISGYFGPTKKSQGTRVIHSLTFHTSRTKYGPFGEELGTYFASGTTQGKVVGFHGRSSMYLDAIGVHMQHWLGNQKPKPSRLKMFS